MISFICIPHSSWDTEWALQRSEVTNSHIWETHTHSIWGTFLNHFPLYEINIFLTAMFFCLVVSFFKSVLLIQPFMAPNTPHSTHIDSKPINKHSTDKHPVSKHNKLSTWFRKLEKPVNTWRKRISCTQIKAQCSSSEDVDVWKPSAALSGWFSRNYNHNGFKLQISDSEL